MNQNAIVSYKTDNGTEVTLTPAIINKVLKSGNEDITDAECKLFVELCKAQHLNPFLREAYLIKYGSSPATTVVGKDLFTKRARRNPDCDGWDAGIIVQGEYQGKTYIKEREGSLVYPHETLVGGYARVYCKSCSHPFVEQVALSEYSTGKSGWRTMPATMIRKVALVHALREAFPEDYQGLYDASEIKDANQGDTRAIYCDAQVMQQEQEKLAESIVEPVAAIAEEFEGAYITEVEPDAIESTSAQVICKNCGHIEPIFMGQTPDEFTLIAKCCEEPSYDYKED